MIHSELRLTDCNLQFTGDFRFTHGSSIYDLPTVAFDLLGTCKSKLTRFDPWGHARTQLGFVVQRRRIWQNASSFLVWNLFNPRPSSTNITFFVNRFREVYPRIWVSKTCLNTFPKADCGGMGRSAGSFCLLWTGISISISISISFVSTSENLNSGGTTNPHCVRGWTFTMKLKFTFV